MQSFKSCGAVIFTRRDSEILYVVIRQINGDHGFPKGHIEPGEDEHATALREIREEVGLNVEIMEGFRQETSYPFPQRPDVIKQSVYYLAAYSAQEICCQPGEVAEAYLLPYEQARELLTFSETKRILTEAHHYLTK